MATTKPVAKHSKSILKNITGVGGHSQGIKNLPPVEQYQGPQKLEVTQSSARSETALIIAFDLSKVRQVALVNL